MKVLAINGSPRKAWNTAALLQAALDGAAEKGAETEMIHLYDIDFKGCRSCFACQRKGVTVEKCVIPDGLSEVLAKIVECDALLLGSPIYFGDVTGEMRSLLERLFFPYLSYDGAAPSFPKRLPSAFIYTTNAPESQYDEVGYWDLYERNKGTLSWLIGPSEYLFASETLQFDDYGKYASGMFDAEERRKRHETVFEEDKARARALGASLVG